MLSSLQRFTMEVMTLMKWSSSRKVCEYLNSHVTTFVNGVASLESLDRFWTPDLHFVQAVSDSVPSAVSASAGVEIFWRNDSDVPCVTEVKRRCLLRSGEKFILTDGRSLGNSLSKPLHGLPIKQLITAWIWRIWLLSWRNLFSWLSWRR